MGKTTSKPLMKTLPQGKQKIDIVAWLALLISILSLCVAVRTHFSDQATKPLIYHIRPTIVDAKDAGGMTTIDVEVEMMVSGGAMGDVRFFNFVDGTIAEDEKYEVQTKLITSSSSKSERTFGFSLMTTSKNQYLVQYVLVNGKDGSTDLSMITYTMGDGDISIRHWTSLDVALAEISESSSYYQVALNNYRTLADSLREKGDL